MVEFANLNYRFPKDFRPHFGLISFKERNGGTIYHNGDWRYKGFLVYHTLWYAGLASLAFLGLSYAMR